MSCKKRISAKKFRISFTTEIAYSNSICEIFFYLKCLLFFPLFTSAIVDNPCSFQESFNCFELSSEQIIQSFFTILNDKVCPSNLLPITCTSFKSIFHSSLMPSLFKKIKLNSRKIQEYKLKYP